MVDYYHILEVPRTAAASEIKASYKRLAMKHHPDHNLNNPFAEDYFKRVNEAYRVLGDSSRKYWYDVGLSVPTASRPYTYPTSQPQYHEPEQSYAPYTNDYDVQNLVSPSMKRKIAFFTLIFCGLMVFFGLWFYGYMNERSARLYLGEAELMYKEKENRYALIKITNALQYKPNYLEAHLLRAKIHISMFNYLRAAEDYDLVISKHFFANEQQKADVYYMRGWCYFKAYNFEDASKDFEVAVTAFPQNERYKFFKVACLLKNGGKYESLCPEIIAAHRAGIAEAEELIQLYCTKN